MGEFKKKLGLKDEFSVELDVKQIDFATTFFHHVDQGDTLTLTGIFDIFSSSKNEYRGTVTPANFKVKRKRKLFDMNGSFAIATGEFHQKGDRLVIDTKVTGMNKLLIPILVFGLIFYGIFILTFLFVSMQSNVPFFVVPFIIVHAGIMLGIPIFLMNRSVKRLKYELERDFYFWTKPFDHQLPKRSLVGS